VPHVRWTQYFSPDGKALHENYWKPVDQFGIPSSHGCAGLLAAARLVQARQMPGALLKALFIIRTHYPSIRVDLGERSVNNSMHRGDDWP
jgi:hypothetical protein